MSRILCCFKRAFTKYPLLLHASQAGALMGVGDQIAQILVEKKSFQNIDFIRTAQFAAVGFCFAGPVLGTWYAFLDKSFGSKGKVTVLKKVACDQLIFAPVFLASLLGVIAVMKEGINDLKSIQLKLEDQYWEILINNWKLWPMVQLVNFNFVPLRNQLLVVQIVAIFWNTYLSWRTTRIDSERPLPNSKKITKKNN